MDDNDLWPVVFSLTFTEKSVFNFRYVWGGGRRAASVHYNRWRNALRVSNSSWLIAEKIFHVLYDTK